MWPTGQYNNGDMSDLNHVMIIMWSAGQGKDGDND